jgi:hypothetical protein
VAPVSPQVGTNLAGPVNLNGDARQVNSGNGGSGDVRQGNFNGSVTALDNEEARSSAVGPIVVPVSPQVGTNVAGPVNANLLSRQWDSGNAGGGDLRQVNDNLSLTSLRNRNRRSTAGSLGGRGGIAGPIVAPVSPQVGTNLAGPVNLNGASRQWSSGNGSFGDVRQLNWNGSRTWLSNQDAQSDAFAPGQAVAGPVLVPVSPQTGTNVNGPLNGSAVSKLRDSGNGNDGATSTAPTGVSGPIVAPVTDDLDNNLSGPADADVGGSQQKSGTR